MSTERADLANEDRPFESREVYVVSNREPYVHEFSGDDITVSRPVGGLTSALDPVLQELGGTWIAWGSGDADTEVVDDNDHVGVPPESPAYELRRVWIDEAALEGYYHGFSNQVLWPICHGFLGKVNYEEEFWERYRDVNQQFASVVVAEVESANSEVESVDYEVESDNSEVGADYSEKRIVDPEREALDPIVWFHDYHFGVAPGLLRDRLPDSATLAHFWHVPWPPWELYRRCPHGRAILDSVLSNDVVGVHTRQDRRHLVQCAREAFDARYDSHTETITHDGHRTTVRVAPLPVDHDSFATQAASEAAESFWTSFANRYDLHDVTVAVGVDRLDYTKGIETRLSVLERLFEEYPRYRGEVTYVQKSSKSRTRIDAYRSLRERVEARIDAINHRFGTDRWQPIVYYDGLLTQTELAGLYRHADIALVTPRRDGLNLVAKEFVAAQIEPNGVLVLSETAGVAETLGENALLVNPLDTRSFLETLEQALEMPEDERRRRMQALGESVRSESGMAWVNRVFGFS